MVEEDKFSTREFMKRTISFLKEQGYVPRYGKDPLGENKDWYSIFTENGIPLQAYVDIGGGVVIDFCSYDANPTRYRGQVELGVKTIENNIKTKIVPPK